MEKYDVVIVGAGPGGLSCADSLAGSGLKVLVVEKNTVVGKKVCAGGLTRKDLKLLPVPDGLIEQKMYVSLLATPLLKVYTRLQRPVLFTVDRQKLGEWQAEKVRQKGIEVRINTRVDRITKNRIIIRGGEEIGYRYLVGADGAVSLVRRYLGIPVEKRIIAMQYQIPWDGVPRFEIYMDSKYFHSWYAWIFPHKNGLVVGTGGDPRFVLPRKMKDKFHRWLGKNKLDITGAVYESYPINYDYRGWNFGRIFLVGDAAGLASGLTGEGIYQALLSGKAAASKIISGQYDQIMMEKMIRYNRIQYNFLRLLIKSGPFRNSIFNLILLYLKINNRFKNRVTEGFS